MVSMALPVRGFEQLCLPAVAVPPWPWLGLGMGSVTSSSDSAVLRGTASSWVLKSEVISFQDLKRAGLLLTTTVWLWSINSSLTPGIVTKSDCRKLLRSPASSSTGCLFQHIQSSVLKATRVAEAFCNECWAWECKILVLCVTEWPSCVSLTSVWCEPETTLVTAFHSALPKWQWHCD